MAARFRPSIHPPDWEWHFPFGGHAAVRPFYKCHSGPYGQVSGNIVATTGQLSQRCEEKWTVDIYIYIIHFLWQFVKNYSRASLRLHLQNYVEFCLLLSARQTLAKLCFFEKVGLKAVEFPGIVDHRIPQVYNSYASERWASSDSLTRFGEDRGSGGWWLQSVASWLQTAGLQIARLIFHSFASKRDLCGCSWLIQSICKILRTVSLPSSEFSMGIVRLLSSGWERLRSESSEWSRPGRPRHELGDVQTPLKDTVESVESVEHDRHWQWVWTREPRCDKRWCNACRVRSDIWRSSYIQCRSKRCIGHHWAKRYRNTSIPEALKIRDIGKFCSAFARVNDCPKFAMGPNRSPALVPVSY